jgi:hypothetical protein
MSSVPLTGLSYLHRCGLSVALLLLLSAGRAHGHHSFAMYDSATLVAVVGTVKEFQWTNPHALLWIVKDAQGKAEPELWTIELPTSPGNLTRMGWSKRSLKPGDQVSVEINPLRDGKHGGSFKKVTLKATGEVLVASAALPDAGTADAAPGPGSDDDHDHDHDDAATQATTRPSGCACSLDDRHSSFDWSVASTVVLSFGFLRRHKRRVSTPSRRRRTRLSRATSCIEDV